MARSAVSRGRRLRRAAGLLFLALTLTPASAAGAAADPAQHWLPSSEGASWTYEWSSSALQGRRTTETYGVVSREGEAFRLGWSTSGPGVEPGQGFMDFQRTTAGLVNLSWSSTAPPRALPILCAQPAQCGNSVAGAHFLVIWGTRSPVLAEPLLRGTTWEATGGAENDVTSVNRYIGRERIVTAAFPDGVEAAKVEADVSQAGALGDPFGSGRRTTYWVHGVGPARVVFRHTGGETTQADLVATSLRPGAPPSDTNYLPLTTGSSMTYRWRNDRHMRTPSVQRFTVAAARNGTARVDVKHSSGPIRIAGSYVFSTRLGGVVNTQAFTRAASKATFPALGPLSEPPSRRRRLLTAMDFMSYGFNPVAPVLPKAGQTWKSRRGSRDYDVFAVTGTARVVGTQRVRTPAGAFQALAVRSSLKQAGTRYGSGTRTAWFAPGKGLVKLTFRHGDGSTSTVERVR